MNIRMIADGHTLDTDLLTGGLVLDVGCRNFMFSQAMHELGEKVVAVDLEYMKPPAGIDFHQVAIASQNGTVLFIPQGEETCTQEIRALNDGVTVKAQTLNSFCDTVFGDKELDVLKLDCEGSEYAVLSDPNFVPRAKQMTVEFHHHVFPELHDRMFQSCMDNLSRYYDHTFYVTHEKWQFMDYLFIRR